MTTKRYSVEEVAALDGRAQALLRDLSEVLAEIAERVSVLNEGMADGAGSEVGPSRDDPRPAGS